MNWIHFIDVLVGSLATLVIGAHLSRWYLRWYKRRSAEYRLQILARKAPDPDRLSAAGTEYLVLLVALAWVVARMR